MEVPMNNIRKALELCKWAPSGGNSQPGEISIHEMTASALTITVSLSNECKASDQMMEANGMASLYSLGALAYTIKKTLALLGWVANLETFKNEDSAYNCYVILTFSKVATATHDLSEIEAILKKRKSNRNLYQRTPLNQDVEKRIFEVIEKYPELELINHNESKMEVASKMALLENIRCQNLHLSKELLNEIHFKDSEIGLSHKTLGQPGWSTQMMKLWKKFNWIRYQFFFGAQWIFRYLSVIRPIFNSGAYFTLQAQETNFKNCYQLGKCLAELWFLVETKNLSLQVFGLPIISLYSQFHPDAKNILSNNHIDMIRKVKFSVKKFGINIDKPCIQFRCGIATKLANLTARRPLKINKIEKNEKQVYQIQGET